MGILRSNSRYATLFFLIGLYVVLSTLTRVIFLFWSSADADFHVFYVIRAFLTGFAFDLASGLSFMLLYALYLLLFPKRWIGSLADKIFTYTYLSLTLFIIFFGLMAEFPFWDEFGVRFNFIAVDYLIYTYEVVSNINQSYPLPLIIAVLLALVAATFILLHKRGILQATFSDRLPFLKRAAFTLPVFVAAALLLGILRNKLADFSNNMVINEVGKNGVFSFFAAFRANELDYDTFYPKMDEKAAYRLVKKNLLQDNQAYTSNQWDNIERRSIGDEKAEIRPNIILIAIESFSADFLSSFGNKNQLTPVYDSLAQQSIFFTNLYATGTRTVRGMEALTLCVPPTPGNSMVRRPDNAHIFSIATVLRQKDYHPYFIYGGDGYFDNMNTFFGGQGFDIVDRDRGNPLSDNISTHRYQIADKDVTFENAWGICDEDLYRQALRYADAGSRENRPFFQFVMTTSNHKPYTFPEGRIKLPQGDRNAAVRYTDYALGKFLADARKKPWFKNTVFLIVADHCASSAGKWEINIDKHHIPAIMYNLPEPAQRIDRLTSQIDLMPTLFGYLNWHYTTALYGKDINRLQPGEERAFIGNYRTLGLLKDSVFTQINDRKQVKQFRVTGRDDALSEISQQDAGRTAETISYYQTASERFKNGKMKEK